ncbi:DUF2190 family protein [Vibrio furnissii]|uniref:DUF2190 family protein n=1 Tax=Vibrio furnissii TaxID=29494 RepID=UPI001EEA39F2|nr:capsid cement protein [Vibrio furnissii]MCG6216268.1 DUF2190 family protein [Vibrio furnissii]
MAKNYVQDGDTIDFIAAADVASGSPVAIGALVGVALDDVKAGMTGVAAANGVWSLPKAAGVEIAQGVSVYLKNGAITTDSAEAVAAGKAWSESAAGDSKVSVNINA